MKRITKKTDTKEGTTIGVPKAIKAYWKLKELEDIEEELGIDLAILVKALKNGIYWVETLNNFRTKIVFSEVVRVSGDYIDAWNNKDKCYTSHILLKDYGSNWALTKEELL